MDTKHIQISDYSYELPDSRIPRFPVTPRDHSKLLVYRQGEVSEDYFYNIANYLPEHSLMVYNNTKVIQAVFVRIGSASRVKVKHQVGFHRLNVNTQLGNFYIDGLYRLAAGNYTPYSDSLSLRFHT